MKLAELHKKGHILPVHLIKKTISWKGVETDEEGNPTLDGKLIDYTGEVFVKRLSYGLVDAVRTAELASDDASRNAVLISSAIRLGERGEEKLSMIEAYNLEPNFGQALLIAIAEVNRMGGKGESADPKASAQ